MPESLIIAAELERSFGSRTAVHLVDFEVPMCGLVGLVGPNGAGKTTLIRLLTGLLRPTSATAFKVLGEDPSSAGTRFRRNIGLVLDARQVLDGMTAQENLRYSRLLYGLPKNPEAELSYLDTVGLQDRANDLAGTLSTGMKQRLNIARALVSGPKFLILDEPTSGLDPVSAHEVHGVLQDLAASGVQVLVSSHNMREVEDLCAHVVMMQSGHAIFNGSPSEVKSQFGKRITTVEVSDGRVDEVKKALSRLASSKYVMRRLDTQWEFVFFDLDSLEDLVALDLNFSSRAVTLEDVFMLLANEGA